MHKNQKIKNFLFSNRSADTARGIRVSYTDTNNNTENNNNNNTENNNNNNNNIYTDSYTYSKNFINSVLFARKRAILTDWPP